MSFVWTYHSLSIHLLKDISVSSKVCNYKVAINILVQVPLENVSFQILCVNTKEYNCAVLLVKVCLALL